MSDIKDVAIRDEIINKRYDELAGKLENALIYGNFVNQENYRELVVAAYYLGIDDESQRFKIIGEARK